MIELIERLVKILEDFTGRIKDFFLWLYLFFLYCLIWPGCPQIGDPEKADIIWGFAFGRNSFPKEEEVASFVERTEPIEGLVDALAKNFDPGNSNFGLAREVKIIMDNDQDIRSILQWEIVLALYKLFPSWFFRNRDRIFCAWPKIGYVTSKDLIADFVAFGGESDQEPIIVSDKRHSVRVVLLVWRFFKKPIVGSLTASFDPFSVQDWIRGGLRWIKRETKVRIHHLIYGWIISWVKLPDFIRLISNL